MKRNGEQTARMREEALSRAVNNKALTNLPAIYAGFVEKGIPEADILPRENVFTFNAWKAKGRYVRRGQRGVRVVTWIPVQHKGEDDEAASADGKLRPWSATVFHISQTEEIAG